MPACLGPTLVVTALTHDQALIDRLLGSDLIGRLNLGPIQTNTIVWDQPHEGNLFDHLYGRRAFQRRYDLRAKATRIDLWPERGLTSIGLHF